MKKALVTGASRGIGKAVAARFAAEGYELYTPVRAELDLGSDESVEAYVRAHADVAFDAIVNVAGINEVAELDAVSDESIARTLQVNVVAPVKLLRGFVPAMKRAGGGRIVNVASIFAEVSREGRGMYAASKAALHGITNTLALELAPYGILVNTVCPGNTMTDLMRRNNTDEQLQRLVKQIPLGRMAQPKEIAEVVWFLASPGNTYITGQKVTVDGGYTAR